MKAVQFNNRKAIIIFLFITFALSSIFYFLIIHTGKIASGSGRYLTGLMWSPGLSAIITSIIFKRKISLLGWQWGKNRYQVLSYFIPLLYILVAYLIIWTIGWGTFYDLDFVNKTSSSFGFEKLPNGLSIFFYFLLTSIFLMPTALANALGEEIGWRGFLTPELYKTIGYTKTSFLTGAIWAVWHFPILLFGDYNSGTPAWYGLTCFSVMIISISFVFTWFRIKSNSVWTAAFLHASHNLFIQAIFTPLTKDTRNTKYFINEFGVVLPLINIFLAVIFWMKRSKLNKSRIPQIPAEKPPQFMITQAN
jgi:uncharacterized protein